MSKFNSTHRNLGAQFKIKRPNCDFTQSIKEQKLVENVLDT